MNLEIIAQVCHQTIGAYQIALGEPAPMPWDFAELWQRESTLDGVLYLLANPDAGPSALHERWMQHKLDTGWRYGQTKDSARKVHPCIVPYHELPETQKAKDRLFLGVVRALGPMLQPIPDRQPTTQSHD